MNRRSLFAGVAALCAAPIAAIMPTAVFARGGRATPGRPFIVGERGPEMIIHLKRDDFQAVVQQTIRDAVQEDVGKALAEYDRGLPRRFREINSRQG